MEYMLKIYSKKSSIFNLKIMDLHLFIFNFVFKIFNMFKIKFSYIKG